MVTNVFTLGVHDAFEKLARGEMLRLLPKGFTGGQLVRQVQMGGEIKGFNPEVVSKVQRVAEKMQTRAARRVNAAANKLTADITQAPTRAEAMLQAKVQGRAQARAQGMPPMPRSPLTTARQVRGQTRAQLFVPKNSLVRYQQSGAIAA